MNGLDVSDKEGREKLIAEFEAMNSFEKFGWDQIVAACPDLAEKYAGIIDEVKQKLQEADALASEIRDRVRASISCVGHDRAKDVAQVGEPGPVLSASTSRSNSSMPPSPNVTAPST